MTSYSDRPIASGHIHQLSVARLAVAGAVTAATMFILCWLLTFLPFPGPTHGYVALFSGMRANSIGALLYGSVWSLLFGGAAGAVFALIYNHIPALDRR